jgi:WD40 repeat protein
MATASADKTAALWDLTDRTHPIRTATLTGHTSRVGGVAFSPEGRTLATASTDGTAALWDVRKIFELLNQLIGRSCEVADRGLDQKQWNIFAPGFPIDLPAESVSISDPPFTGQSLQVHQSEQGGR